MRLSIKQQLFLILVIFVVLATALLGSFMYIFFSDKMSEFMFAEIDYDIQQSVLESENILKRIQNFNDYISVEAKMVNAIKTNHADVTEQVYAVNSLKREFESLFNMYFSDNYNLAVPSFFIDKTQSVASMLPEMKEFEDFGDVPILRRSSESLSFLQEKGKRAQEDIFTFYEETSPGCIFFGQFIYDNVSFDGSILGVMIFRVNIGRLLVSYNSTNTADAISIAVLDREDNIVVKPEFVKNDVLLSQVAQMDQNSIEGFDRRESVTLEEYQVGRYSMQYGLRLFAFLDTASLSARLGGLWIYVLLFVILILAVLIFIANMMAERLSEPIVHLSRVMMSFDEKAEVSLSDEGTYTAEVGKLYQCFSHMVIRIKELMKQAKESGEREKEMEMRMLNAQINPHFLYNALDSISWMAIDNGEDEIAEMLNILSESFRYSIKQVDELISVREEMAFIIGYLQLQEMRYKNKFIFSLNISSEIEKMMIPKFIIQPLVENFVIHGMKPGGQNVLTISAHAINDFLEIAVSDNGVGCDAKQLNRYIAGDDSVFPKEKIGIKNVNSRIKIKFGDLYGLHYHNNDNGGTLAKLTLPIIDK